MSYRDTLVNPRVRFTQLRYQAPYSIVPERVFPLATLNAVSLYVFLVLAPRTELLHEGEIGNV